LQFLLTKEIKERVLPFNLVVTQTSTPPIRVLEREREGISGSKTLGPPGKRSHLGIQSDSRPRLSWADIPRKGCPALPASHKVHQSRVFYNSLLVKKKKGCDRKIATSFFGVLSLLLLSCCWGVCLCLTASVLPALSTASLHLWPLHLPLPLHPEDRKENYPPGNCQVPLRDPNC
jgi:hypothetical protein